MSSELLGPNREAAIWARLMQAQKDELSPEAAEYLLSVAFAESDRERMMELAERSESGTLTVDERQEFESICMSEISWPSCNGKPGSPCVG